LKATFLTVLAFLYVQYTNAQNKTATLNVFVQAAKNDSVNNTTLQLYLLPDTNLIASQVFKKAGNNFAVSHFSKYIIKASCIGFEPVSRTVNVIDKTVYVTLALKK